MSTRTSRHGVPSPPENGESRLPPRGFAAEWRCRCRFSELADLVLSDVVENDTDVSSWRVSVKRYIGLLAIVAIVVAGSTTRAVAQPASDEWKVLVAPYLMGAAMSGATTVRGVTVDVDASASDIFSNLQFGAMGMVVARKGAWGFGADAIWMALGTTVRDTNVDFNQGAFAFYGLRQLGPAADVTFGLRVNTLQGELTFNGPRCDAQPGPDLGGSDCRPHPPYLGRSPRARTSLHRGRRIRRRLGFHVAAISHAEPQADGQGIVGVRVSMVGPRLRQR